MIAGHGPPELNAIVTSGSFDQQSFPLILPIGEMTRHGVMKSGWLFLISVQIGEGGGRCGEVGGGG